MIRSAGMTTGLMAPLLLSSALSSALLAGVGQAQDSRPVAKIQIEEAELALGKDKSLGYLIAKPSDFDAKKPARLFFALPPGPGTRKMADFMMGYLGKAAAERGYLVVCPVARQAMAFREKGSLDAKALLDSIEKQYRIEPGRVALVGVSNGGRAAVQMATQWPERFGAIAVLPGAPTESTRLAQLWGKPVYLRVGSKDGEGWRKAAKSMARLLGKQGCTVDLKEMAGQGHVVDIDKKHFFAWVQTSLDRVGKPVKKLFPSKDGLELTADLYGDGRPGRPIILLCHQARYSRGEYKDIAPRLVRAGFNCLALDARSGKAANGINNESAARAQKAGKATGYMDARQDIEAAIDWIRKQGFDGKLTLWGSSYSSSLALLISAANKEVGCVLSFSPGDYFKPRGSVTAACRKLDKPVLIVAPERERRQSEPLYKALATTIKLYYCRPQNLHGSKTLFKAPNREASWRIVLGFLGEYAR